MSFFSRSTVTRFTSPALLRTPGPGAYDLPPTFPSLPTTIDPHPIPIPTTPTLNSSFTSSPRPLPSHPIFTSPLKTRRFSTPPSHPHTPPAPPPALPLHPSSPATPTPTSPATCSSSPSFASPSSSSPLAPPSLTSSAQKRRLHRKAQRGLPLHPLPPIITSPTLLTPPSAPGGPPSLPPHPTPPAVPALTTTAPPSCRRFRFTAQDPPTDGLFLHPISSLASPVLPDADESKRLQAAYMAELSSTSLLTSQLSEARGKISGLETQLLSLHTAHELLDEVSGQQAAELASLRDALDAERRRYSEAAAALSERAEATTQLRLTLEARTTELQQSRETADGLRTQLQTAQGQTAAAEEENGRLVASVAALQAQVAGVKAERKKAPAAEVSAERVRRLEGVRLQLEELRRGLEERLEGVGRVWGRGGQAGLEETLRGNVREVEGLLRENEETMAAVQRGVERCQACGERHGGDGGEELRRVNRELRVEVERLRKEAGKVGEKRGREQVRHEGGKENHALTPLQPLSNRQNANSGEKRRRSLRE